MIAENMTTDIMHKGAVAHGDYFFLNQHNFLITKGMTLFFLYIYVWN